MTRGKSVPEDEADRAGIRMCAESKPVWFDPHSQIAGASRVFSDNVVPGLLSLGDDDAPARSLAQDWHWADDRTLILDLDPTMTFASGRAVDAAAARENIERILSGEGAPFNHKEFLPIESLDADGLRLRIRLSRPSAPVVGALANGLGIVDAAASRPGLPVGAGPWTMAAVANLGYRFVSRARKDLSLNWLFCGSDACRRRRIASADAEVMLGGIGARWAEEAGWQRVAGPGNGPMHLAFNLRRWPAADLHFRRQIAEGIDREEVIRVGFGGLGEASASPFSTASRFAMNDDELEAVRAVPLAGRRTGYPTLSLVVGGSPFLKVARAVAAQVQRLTGAKVQVRSIPNPQWWPGVYLSGDWDLALQVWTPMADPHFIYQRRYATTGIHNAPGYSSEQLDDAVRRAESSIDLATRMKWYHVAEEARRRDLPTIYLGFPNRVVWSRPGTRVPAPRRNWFVDFEAFG